MEKNQYILWFCEKPIVVIKEPEGEKTIFRFYCSYSKYSEIGITEADLQAAIEDFIKHKEERTVLSEDIEQYELINLDD